MVILCHCHAQTEIPVDACTFQCTYFLQNIFEYRLFFSGALLNKAREKVIADGYPFVKGKSRSRSGSETELESPLQKRSKINAAERSREIQLLEENLKLFNDRLNFKERQLEKERCLKNFKECDNVTQQMIQIRKERASVERHLSALKKREAKSVWYKQKSTRMVPPKQGERASQSQKKISTILKKKSSGSSSSSSGTDDTIILSDSERFNSSTIPASQDTAYDSQDNQDFSQVPPEMENMMEGN
jgi:hypothetical protein